jgi:hypothetical protein
VSTRQINTTVSDIPSCEVCGRTLLRGEHVSTYIHGSARRSVCELCESRALHEGWVREGSIDTFETAGTTSERRRSLFGRRRSRRETPVSPGGSAWEDDSSASSWAQRGNVHRSAPPRTSPRQVHAVPSSDGQRVAKAVDLFNRSESRRTIAGVARSLGQPTVSANPVDERPSLVSLVVSWELCWYRYEVDLSDDSIRVGAQGYELDDLDERERLANAVADEFGQISLVDA